MTTNQFTRSQINMINAASLCLVLESSDGKILVSNDGPFDGWHTAAEIVAEAYAVLEHRMEQYSNRFPINTDEAKLSASVAYAEAFYAAKKSRANLRAMQSAQQALADYQVMH